MNDSTARPEAEPVAAATEPVARAGARRWWPAIAVALAVLVVSGYVLIEARRESAQRQQIAEQNAREIAAVAARTDAAVQQAQQAQRRLDEVEAQAASAAPSLDREQVTLFEVERLVMLAASDVQLTRQTGSALAALELADARLAAAGNPRWLPLRRAIGRDLERLRATPAADVTGIALRLDQLIGGADVWPLVSGSTPPPAKAAPRTAKKNETAEPPSPTVWERLRAWLTQEFGDLLRIREVATPEPLLLGESQQKLLRQQFKLRLLGARLSALARNDRLYHADVEQAQTLLALYFDSRHPPVAAAANLLRQLNAAPLVAELPSLADSQSAVRALRATKR